MDFGGFFRERRFYESPLAIRAYRALRAVAARLGFHVVLKTFYSPIPELDRLPPGWFEREAALPGLELGLDRQLELLEQRLAGPMAEFDPPAAPAGDPHRYSADNPSFGRLDASVLYAMVRALRPRRIVELGSGHSTLVMAEAVRRNAAEGVTTRLETYDPYAALVRDDLPGLERLHRVPVQDVPAEVFEALGEGDVLFVDTTHTVKVGSDVNAIVLDVLPRLAAGVVVHIHDVYLPFEYPRDFLDAYGLYWNEQYLVQAFLAMNPGYEVLFANAALSRLRTEAFLARAPKGVPPHGGGSFWIRRTGAGTP